MTFASPTRGLAAFLLVTSLLAAGCTAPGAPTTYTSGPAAAPSGAPAAAPSGAPAAAPSGAPAAAPSGAPAAAPSGVASAAPALIKAHGKITEVASDKKSFTIAHDDIPEIPMKAMTMPYTVSDAAVLEGMQAGQEVDFFIDDASGELIVVRITPTKP